MQCSKKEFGLSLRKARINLGFTLRKFANEIGKSPTYISRLELGDVDFPAEETIKKMARVLNKNEDKLLGRVGKISSDLKNIITEKPVEISNFLRVSAKLNKEQWAALNIYVQELKKEKIV